MSHNVKVAVFARAPVLGEVKTRLAQGVGVDEALRTHQLLLDRTLGLVTRLTRRDANWSAELWLAGNAEALLDASPGLEIPLLAQVDGNLGQRMCAAAENVVERGSWPVIIGCDCPMMSVDYLERAIAALVRGDDVVFGPAEDGGYVLIAVRDSYPRLFDEIAWSTPLVLEQSLARAEELDLNVTLLERLWDVDTIEDWRRWRGAGESGALGAA